ncbi:hypothetical protein ED312_02865 [Sinomicrobium pectinilyticum]|uniref:Uncharacterized protein n=1 Tax=Sinomicrobium pectinilyticum TaxID=1084421 RepID=A0A3N0EZ14_SINP1|nr:hypothetical protein ED312_02865 [Sinomicrobium pectinilyticum]
MDLTLFSYLLYNAETPAPAGELFPVKNMWQHLQIMVILFHFNHKTEFMTKKHQLFYIFVIR